MFCKKAFLAYSSPLILTMVCCGVTVDSFAQDKPHYVEAQDNVGNNSSNPDTVVPKLSPDQVTSITSGSDGSSNTGPYRLSHSLGLTQGSRIKVNGFVSAGVAHTDSSKDYQIPGHGNVGNHFNFNTLSLLGVQLTAKLYKGLSVVGQVVANGDDTNGNTAYSVNLDYGFVRYAFNDKYQIQAGRFRLPAFLYSQTQEIGYTYPWVVLPNEVYRIVPFANMNGFDTIMKFAIGSSWNVSFQPYVGSSRSEFDLYNSSAPDDTYAVQTAKFQENDLIGIVVGASNKYITLRGTYAHLKLTGTVDLFNNGAFQSSKFVNNQSDSFYSFGAKLNYKGLQASSEYAHRETPAPLASLSGVYGMLGYKFFGILPNFTYARIWTTNKSSLRAPGSTPTTPADATELAQEQESYTLGLNYYLNSNVVFKTSVADVRPLDGTRGLFDTVQPGQLKKNNMLYMVGIDAIF